MHISVTMSQFSRKNAMIAFSCFTDPDTVLFNIIIIIIMSINALTQMQNNKI